MVKKSGLGRGLDALLGDNAISDRADTSTEGSNEKDRATKDDSGRVLEISIYDIDPNPNQPRKTFEAAALEELTASIEHSGVIQPLIVQEKDGRYRIVAGERRWRAAKAAGLKKVPIIVRDLDDRSLLEYSLVENLQRSDLNPLEEAEGIRLLMLAHDLTQEEVAKSLGKSRPVIANAIRILSLPEEVLQYVKNNELTSGHARTLVSLNDESLQIKAAKEIVKKKLSVRETERLCKALLSPKEAKEKFILPEISQAQTELQNRLETKVRISGNGKRGKITIDYYSTQQLEQLYEYLNREN